ncbi:MAG: transporter related protein, partial [Xanthobacteraceae bacterium]|nr:transporter related protein [Xanthobacteraceae bacterium]
MRLRALAHPARLAILRALAAADRCQCGQIVRGLTLAQSTVSQHLKVLKEAGLITGTIEGPRSCYCLDRRNAYLDDDTYREPGGKRPSKKRTGSRMSASEGGAAPARPAKASEINPRGSLLVALKGLWPYLWPVDRADLRARVMWGVLLLVLAKLATMTTPFFFKWATDAAAEGEGARISTDAISLIIAAPLVLTLAYGFSRIVMAGLTQWRDGLFAKVAIHAVR